MRFFHYILSYGSGKWRSNSNDLHQGLVDDMLTVNDVILCLMGIVVNDNVRKVR